MRRVSFHTRLAGTRYAWEGKLSIPYHSYKATDLLESIEPGSVLEVELCYDRRAGAVARIFMSLAYVTYTRHGEPIE